MISAISLMKLTIVLPSLVSCISASQSCCKDGQTLHKEDDECWDAKANTTTSVSLNCKDTIRFFKNYIIIDAEVLLLTLGDNFNETFDPSTYCMGVVPTTNGSLRQAALICADEEEEKIIDDRVLGYTSIVSVIFLTTTGLIYGFIPELRDVQGKSIINFCASLAIGLGILAIMKLMAYYDMALCAARGFLAYFFLIAAFFWTNAISIQVLLSTRRPATLDYGWREFRWYAVYAWGCPTVLTIAMAIVNFHPGNHQKPGIGLNHCWFWDRRQQWYYMYSVMSLLLAANIAIFIYSSMLLWRLSFTSFHITALKYKFAMTVRLIILMGLPWVFEMIGSVSEQHIVWVILDVFNTLQGVLIFLLLVVFRRRVIKMMYKHGWLNCISGFVEKYLATEDDEENVVQHTDVPMHDRIDTAS